MAKQKPETDPADEMHRSFNFLFARLANQEAHREASAELHGLLSKLKTLSQMKRGAAVGKLTITVSAKVDGDMVAFGYDVTTKEPKPPREGTLCWLTRGGNVAFEDPKQLSLKGVREVPRAEPEDDELLDVDGTTGEVAPREA
jgi:hypothetical protein